MSADQIAEIAPFIREVFAHANKHAPTDETLCATFEVVGVDGAWAQVTLVELNMAYPLGHSPEEELGEIVRRLPGGRLLSWEPYKFATWSFVSVNPAEVAKAVDLIFAKVFRLTDYAIDGQLEHL